MEVCFLGCLDSNADFLINPVVTLNHAGFVFVAVVVPSVVPHQDEALPAGDHW